MAAAREFAHEAAEGLRAPSSTRFRDALYLLLANKVGLMGGLLTLFVLCMAGVGWVVLATDSLHHLYLDQNLSDSLLAPGVNGHTLGTDQYGRDILWRTIVGTGISMLIAIVATSVTLVFGMAMGGIAGYVGGKVDTVITALIDLTWGFPLLLVAVIYAGVLEPGLARRDPRRRDGRLGRLRAGRAGPGEGPARARVRRGGSRARHADLEDPAPAPVPQRAGHGAGDGVVLRRHHGHRGGRLLVHRPGRAAADPEPGADDLRRAQLLDDQHLSGHRARRGHRHHRARR